MVPLIHVGTPATDLNHQNEVVDQAEMAVAGLAPWENWLCHDGAVVTTWGEGGEHYASFTSLADLGTGAATTYGLDKHDPLPNPLDWLFVCGIMHPKYVSKSNDVLLIHLPGGVVGQLGLGQVRRQPYLLDGEPCSPMYDHDYLAFRVSTQCGRPGTWTLTSVIEPGPSASASLDRPEIYYDRYRDDIYVTTASSAYVSRDYPANHAQSWNELPPMGTNKWTPVMISAASQGRVYFLMGSAKHLNGGAFQSEQLKVKLKYTDDRGDTLHEVPLPDTLDYSKSILGSRTNGVNSIPGEPRMRKGTVGFSVIESTPSRDVLRMALPVFETTFHFDAWQRWVYHDRQSLRLVTFEVDKNRNNTVSTLSSVMLRASSGHPDDSIFDAQLIESSSSDRSLLTWHETDSTGASVEIYQRAVALGDVNEGMSNRVDVNVSLWHNPWGFDFLFPQAWSTQGMHWVPQFVGGVAINDRNGVQKGAHWTGDYRYGAFLDDDGQSWRFLVGWAQPDPAMTGAGQEAHVNLVSITNPEAAR